MLQDMMSETIRWHSISVSSTKASKLKSRVKNGQKNLQMLHQVPGINNKRESAV